MLHRAATSVTRQWLRFIFRKTKYLVVQKFGSWLLSSETSVSNICCPDWLKIYIVPMSSQSVHLTFEEKKEKTVMSCAIHRSSVKNIFSLSDLKCASQVIYTFSELVLKKNVKAKQYFYFVAGSPVFFQQAEILFNQSPARANSFSFSHPHFPLFIPSFIESWVCLCFFSFFFFFCSASCFCAR